MDYDGFDVTISFPPSDNGAEICRNITIRNDEAFENNEFFSVHVESERNVVIHIKYAIVHIQDDDRKFTTIFHWDG